MTVAIIPLFGIQMWQYNHAQQTPKLHVMLDIDYEKSALFSAYTVPMLVTARSWQFQFLRAKELFRREDGASLCNSTSLPLSLLFHCKFIPTCILLLLIFYATCYTSRERERERKGGRRGTAPVVRHLITSWAIHFTIFPFFFFFLLKKRGVTL